jgi:hypothetical protein
MKKMMTIFSANMSSHFNEVNVNFIKLNACLCQHRVPTLSKGM